MKLLLLLFPFVCYSQAVSWSQVTLIPSTTINNSSTEKEYAFTTGSGFSLQTQITCPGTCSVDVTVSGSVDGNSYQAIPELTQNYTATTTNLYNVYMQFWKWMKVEISETTGNNATVTAIMGIKSQL